MTIKPTLSVIVPTYQGADHILNTLNSLERQRFRDFEVIVVIDGSTDSTERVIKEATFTFSLQVCVQPNKGRAGARNAGVSVARADTLIFFDDDLVFEGDVLSQYHTLTQEGYPIVVGGLYGVPSSGPDEFFNYTKYLDSKWVSGITETSRGVLKHPYLTAANCMLSLEAFKQLGGFDERLRDAEDFDLAIKAFEKHIPIVLDKEILVGHHVQTDFGTYAKRLVEYQKARKMLARVNPDATKHFAASVRRSRGKKILYAWLSGQYWIDLIDKNVFRIMPRKLRFRIYDLLLTAHSVTRTTE
jgi:glycosyltransferase involved in cell wall biosynthesis